MGRDERFRRVMGPGPRTFGGVPIIGGTSLVVKDARGRDLQVGDEILLMGPAMQQGFRVLRIAPASGPNVPPGIVRVEIASFATFHAAAGQPALEFMRIRTTEEAGLLPIKLHEEGDPLPADDPNPLTADPGLVE